MCSTDVCICRNRWMCMNWFCFCMCVIIIFVFAAIVFSVSVSTSHLMVVPIFLLPFVLHNNRLRMSFLLFSLVCHAVVWLFHFVCLFCCVVAFLVLHRVDFRGYVPPFCLPTLGVCLFFFCFFLPFFFFFLLVVPFLLYFVWLFFNFCSSSSSRCMIWNFAV